MNKGYDKLSRKEQILKFAEVFMVSRMYQEFFGGGAAMSDVAMQEFASIRAKTLDTEQTLKRLYEHVQRPQPGRQLQPLINFGNPVGGQPRVFGAAVGQFYREQAHLQFLNHSIRYGQIRNFITVQQRYEVNLRTHADCFQGRRGVFCCAA